jgi:hypothetical protein
MGVVKCGVPTRTMRIAIGLDYFSPVPRARPRNTCLNCEVMFEVKVIRVIAR